MSQNRLFQHGSFAAMSIGVTSLAGRGVEELNQLSGLEAVCAINVPGYGGVVFFQSSDVEWEYDYYMDTRNVGLRGFFGTEHRRETICADLEEKVKDGWRVVSVVEGSSGILIFVFKRPVQGEAGRQAEGDA